MLVFSSSLWTNRRNSVYSSRGSALPGATALYIMFLELRAGVNGYQLAPTSIDVRCPQVLKTVWASRAWTAGATPIRSACIKWSGASRSQRFLDVIGHRDRNLPLVAVSEYEGETLAPNLADELAQDLCGLAIVARIDEELSWALTHAKGRDGSCYNGAIRVFWPMGTSGRRRVHHPLWTRERLLDKAGTPWAAASRIRYQLRRQLFELSTYGFDESQVFSRIRDDYATARLADLKAAAKESGDWEQLAQKYADEADRQKKHVSELQEANDRLQDQNTQLVVVYRYAAAAEVDEIMPEPAPQLDSVQQAVALAREEFGNELIFGGDVDDGVGDLAPDAGPPDKIYEQLKILAGMTRLRRSGGLGRTMIDWLTQSGAKASTESDTVRNSQAEIQKRTWHDGTRSRHFDAHLKPSEGTSPDRCVRIYFDYDDASQMTLFGCVGRHP